MEFKTLLPYLARTQKLPQGNITAGKRQINLCVVTSLSLGLTNGGVDRITKFSKHVSKHGVNVFLLDRSREKSLSAMIIDKDKYVELKDGKAFEHQYPFYLRFLLAGVIKFFQEAMNLWFAFLTGTPGSEVSYFYLLDPYLVVKLFFVCKKEKINAIQCEFPFTTFASLMVKKFTGIPLVSDAHNIESDRIDSMPKRRYGESPGVPRTAGKSLRES